MSRRVFGSRLASIGFLGFRACLFLLTLSINTTNAIGQSHISLRNGPGTILNPESFLDLDIVNSNSSSIRVYVQVDLYDIQKQLLSLSTDFFQVNTGLTVLTHASVAVR